MRAAVPLLSRESRYVKHDAGRSPDFRFFPSPSRLMTVVIEAENSPMREVYRSQWRGRGGFFTALPYSPIGIGT